MGLDMRVVKCEIMEGSTPLFQSLSSLPHLNHLTISFSKSIPPTWSCFSSIYYLNLKSCNHYHFHYSSTRDINVDLSPLVSLTQLRSLKIALKNQPLKSRISLIWLHTYFMSIRSVLLFHQFICFGNIWINIQKLMIKWLISFLILFHDFYKLEDKIPQTILALSTLTRLVIEGSSLKGWWELLMISYYE